MTMYNKPTPRKSLRKLHLEIESLENREVLATPSATWIGQTGIDLVGPWSELKPSTIQDISVQLGSLPTDRSISKAVIQGHGADRWEYGGPAGSWLVDLQRAPGSANASLFFEPARLETGREFSVGLTFDDGSFQEIYFPGGFADPNLKVAGQGLQATWLGSSAGVDLTTPSAAIGPDGITDLQISLTQLDTSKSIKAVDLVDANNIWIASYGLNPSRVGTAQLSQNQATPSQATLTFSAPNRPIAGPLTIQVTYSNDSKDSATCALGSIATNPATISPDVTFTPSLATASWLGQVVTAPDRPGWERITVSNLPVRGISAWQLNDPSGQTWLWTISGQGSPWTPIPDTRSLIASQDLSGNWTLEFDSRWDLAGSALNLLAASNDGSVFSIDLMGGAVNLDLRSPAPDLTEIVTAPGTDLQDLVNRFGTVRLSDGIYKLTQPLILKKPIQLIGSPQSILQFSQPADSTGWTSAIKLAAGNILLSGFQVQFDGTIHWLDNIRYGPAVIGTPDNYDIALGRIGPMPNIVVDGLNIQGPKPNSANEEAPRLMRLIGDVSGQICHNTLFGGLIEVVGGPWSITANTQTGTWPGAFNYDVIAAHDTHGLSITDNIIAPIAASGTLFRFLVVNGRSNHVNVINNQVTGLGAKFSDPPEIQSVNAHEVVLTEAYHVDYEGLLLGLDSTRRQIRVGAALGLGYQPGDQIAILDGSAAGSYSTIQAVINTTTLLLDKPLPTSVNVGTAISINKGIDRLNFSGNTIDQTNRPQSLGMVFVGNLYGLNISNNTIIGGLRGLQVIAYPSETPLEWGWTRNVVQGLTMTGNRFADVLWFNQVAVSHSSFARANYGRLYLTGEISSNTFQWSDRFLRQQIGQLPTDSNLLLPALQIGEQGIWDDHESSLKLGNNYLDLPTGWLNRPALWTQSGTVNGLSATGQLLNLSLVPKLLAPVGLALVNDTGISASDGLTNDARLRFNAAPGVMYEYRTNKAATWQPIASPSQSWSPFGLVQGLNQIEVRAYDATNLPGPSAIFTFQLDTVAPDSPSGLVQKSFVLAGWNAPATPDITTITASLTNSYSTETQTLAPNALGTIFNQWAIGPNKIEVYATDAAGNRSASTSATWNYFPSGTWGGQDGSDFAGLFNTLKPDGKQDIRLNIQGLPFNTAPSSIIISAFGGSTWAWTSTPTRAFAAYWQPSSSGRSGSLYFQTNRREIGRPFNITITFKDGSTQNFWIQGGQADPNLHAKISTNSVLAQASAALTAMKGSSNVTKLVKNPTVSKPITTPNLKQPILKKPPLN
ncbi:MAG: hypothetical protein NT172_06955 [Planctomycetota bacterium]|nr:hypothetical protein [Planctomycetota bacterium]